MSGNKTLNQLFWEACSEGEEAKVNAAIVLEVDVNTKDGKGRSGLVFAIVNKCENIVDILLANPDIDINGKDSNERFPLWIAAWKGWSSVVGKLAKMPALIGVNDSSQVLRPTAYGKWVRGVFVNDQGLFAFTPLIYATVEGKESKLLFGKVNSEYS